jgi:hypothetical protein
MVRSHPVSRPIEPTFHDRNRKKCAGIFQPALEWLERPSDDCDLWKLQRSGGEIETISIDVPDFCTLAMVHNKWMATWYEGEITI